eukprot:399338_1
MPAAESLAFTGYQSSANRIWIVTDYIYYYDLDTNTFKQDGTLPITLYVVNAQCSSPWGDTGIMFVNYGYLYYFKYSRTSVSEVTTLPYNRDAPCIAVDNLNNPRYIFITGGVDYSNEESIRIQIYDYTNHNWIYPNSNQPGAPYLNHARGKHACTVFDNYLYVFGGSYDYNTYTYTVQYNEKLDVSDPYALSTKTWDASVQYISNNNVYFHRAVSDTNYKLIYLIGGRDSIDGSSSKNIQIYDPSQNKMTLISSSSMRLHTGRSSPGVIMANNRIYVFGGSDSNSYSYSSWEYSNIMSLSPTSDPTSIPTTNPTATPTNPTVNPTFNPTSNPTNNPTIIPTANPTQTPTSPTFNPTFNPTLSPTYAYNSTITSFTTTHSKNAFSASWANIQFIILCVVMMICILIMIFLTMYKFSKSQNLHIMKKIQIIAVFHMVGYFLSYLFWLICIIILYNNDENR